MTSKLYVLLIIFTLNVTLIGSAQEQSEINITVRDELTGQVIEKAHVRVEKQKTGSYSNRNGEITLYLKELPAKLEFSHVSYQDKSLSITSKGNMDVYLKPAVHKIGGVEIVSDKVINIIKDKPLFVWDYEIYDDYLLFLAYYDKSMFKPRLILFNTEGDSMAVMPAKKARSLFKDCTDNVHLITRNEVSQIYYDGHDLQLIYSYPVNMLDSLLTPCIEKLDSNYYFHQYYYKNQALLYYYFNQESGESKELTLIEDSMRVIQAYDEARFASMGSYNEFDKLFADLIMFAPVYAPLRKIDDHIFIFDFSNGLIKKFSEEGILMSEVRMTFHKEPNLKKELLVDESRHKVYVVFEKNGFYSLSEVDLLTGALMKSMAIPSYPFIEKMKVHRGFVYFLYREKDFQQFKKLYKMPLE